MPDETFPVEVVQGVPVVTAPQEIDTTNAEALRSALLKATASGHRTLVVDMTQTQFCDSSGLHAMVAAHRRAKAEGREVRLVIPSAAILRVFALTGMDRVIPTFTSLAEALARPGPAPAGELPGTLKRSSTEAQETFTRALTDAIQVHGAGDQAVRTAYVEFKRAFEKRGDHWILKQPGR